MQRNILHQKRDQTQTALGVLGAFSCITKLIHDYARANSGGTYDIRGTQVCLTFSWIFDVEKKRELRPLGTGTAKKWRHVHLENEAVGRQAKKRERGKKFSIVTQQSASGLIENPKRIHYSIFCDVAKEKGTYTIFARKIRQKKDTISKLHIVLCGFRIAMCSK